MTGRLKENKKLIGCHMTIFSTCETCFTHYSVAVSQAGLRYAMGIIMKNITVALIDSGINYLDPYFKPYISGGKSFTDRDENLYLDDNGHGSLCASAIINECPNVRLYIEKVLNSNNISSLDMLMCSMENLLDIDVDVVSMSLTLTAMKREEKLKKVCNQLEEQGKVVICSLANGASKSYPANFNSTIGVKGYILENENAFWYKSNKRIQAVVDSNPVMHRNEHCCFELFGKCNSYSTAKFTGLVSHIIDKYGKLRKRDLDKILEEMAVRTEWTNRQLTESKRFPSFNPLKSYNCVLLNRVADIARDYLQLANSHIIYEHGLFDRHIGLNYKNAFGLLKKLEVELDVKILNYASVSRYDFYSIYCLEALIEKNMNIKGSD
jgi:hypothetical protein